MMPKILFFLLWFSVWCLLNWPPDAVDLAAAVLASLAVCFMTLDILKDTYDRSYTPSVKRDGFAANAMRPAWFVYYVTVFLWECLKANFDVAYRVVHPDLIIRPGTVKVKVRLKSDIGLTFLANSITLTPGTTSVDIDKPAGYLYVHCLFIKDLPGKGGAQLPIVTRFERILERIFE